MPATPEQRERLARGRETAAANRALRQQLADMENVQPPRAPRAAVLEARRPSPNEEFLARSIGEQMRAQAQPRGRMPLMTPAMQKAIATTVLGEGEEMTFDETGFHVGAKLVHLYRPTEWGCEPVNVPYTNINMCLNAGMRTKCFDCGGDCQPDAMNPTPNTCPGRQKFATMRCPICRKVLYDFGARKDGPAPRLNEVRADVNGNDGTELGQDAYTALTPASRLKAASDQHIDAFHRNAGLALGLVLPDDRRPV